jgi:lipoate-protein ligase A
MALDLLWMEHIPEGGAIYRAYAWAEPTATFGYFQSLQQVQKLVPAGWTLQRRPTGGGLVLHPNGFTYTLLVSCAHAWFRLPAQETYRLLHESIVNALRAVGVHSSLVASCSPCDCDAPAVKACQSQPVLYDVVENRSQRKIAGAAMKRNRHGLLFQGHLWAESCPQILDVSFTQAWLSVLENKLHLEIKNQKISIYQLWSTEDEKQLIQELQSAGWQDRR